MKKVLILTFVLIFCFGIGISYVSAIDVEGTRTGETSSSSANCGTFGDPKKNGTFANYLQKIFNIMKFLGIVLAIIMTMKDLTLAIADDNKDMLAKLGKKTLKRIIYAVLIFFLPDLINLSFDILGLYGTCGIS